MILTYHKIDPEARTEWWISPDAFYLQMLDLRSKKVVYLDDYDPTNPNQAVITFDGVYQNVWKYAVPILKHFNYPFELFIIGKYVGKDNQFDTGEPLTNFADAETLSKMIQAGGRLQWHTWTHGILSGDMSQEDCDRELIVPSEIRGLCPDGFKWFAFPHGKNDGRLRAQLQQHFTGALACDGGDVTDRYNLERVTSFEKSRFTNSMVSVIIPCYNYGHLAAEAIESVLNQTYPPDEILFIDDASSDNSVEVARRYEPLIRVEVNQKNLGVVGNFRKAVEITRGDYICFLGADNRFRADYIELTKATLDANPDVAVAYTHYVLFDQRAGVEALRTNAVPHPKIDGFFLREFPADPKVDITETNYMHGSSMYRRKAYDQVGGYSEGNLPEDHSLFARMLGKGWKAKLVDAYILEYRQHSRYQVNQLKTFELENVYFRAQNHSLSDQLAQEKNLFAKKEQALASLTEQLAQKDQALEMLSEQLAQKDQALQMLLMQMAEKQQAVQTLQAQLSREEQNTSVLTIQLHEIIISKAWRLAMLMRRLSIFLFPPESVQMRLARKIRPLLFLPFRLRKVYRRNQDLKLIQASGLFNPGWYLANNPDVAQAGPDPLLHFLVSGGSEGRDPGPDFSSAWYLATYEDVRKAGINPLVHYLKYGQEEGRSAKPEINNQAK